MTWSADDTMAVADQEKVRLRLTPVPAAIPGLGEAGIERCLDDIKRTAPEGPPVVVLYPASVDAIDELGPSTQRRLCALGHDLPLAERAAVGILPVSPWDLGSVERVARALRWSLATRFLRYPEKVSTPPDRGIDLQSISTWVQRGAAGGLRIVRPPLDHELSLLGLEKAVKKAEAEVEDLRRARKEAFDAVHEASRRGDATGQLNAEKRARGAELGAAEQDLEKLRVFAETLSAGAVRSQALLICPTCGTAADPRREFIGGPEGRFRCTCGECGSTWGTQCCPTCHHWFPTLMPRQGGWDAAVAADRWGWVDRLLGSDVLAVPCSKSGAIGAFICPACGECPCPSCAES